MAGSSTSSTPAVTSAATSLTSISKTVTLDGSKLEGGGQILRNAVAYTAILRNTNLTINNIRANRKPKPGLRAQHLTSIKVIANISGDTLIGGDVGSTEILYQLGSSDSNCTSNDDNSGSNDNSNSNDDAQTSADPNKKQRFNVEQEQGSEQTIVADTGTAGSVCLLLQAILPYTLFGKGSNHQRQQQRRYNLILKGGTNAAMAPQYDYWEHVFLPVLHERMGIPRNQITASVKCRGYYPRGGGEVHVHTTPLCDNNTNGKSMLHSLEPSLTERGDVSEVIIRTFYSGKCPKRVAVQTTDAAKQRVLQIYPGIPIKSEVVYHEQAVGSSSGILLVATTTTGCRLGGSALGSPKKSPIEVGIEAATELCSTLADGGCVDEYLQDQLILYVALASGVSEMITGSLTLHTRTAIWTAEQLCPNVKFEISRLDEGRPGKNDEAEGRIPGRHLIRCKGIGI